MSKVSLNLTLLAAHLALVAAATSLALLITQLALHPPFSDLALLAALMTLLGLAATLFGHLAISLAPHLSFASLQARIGGASVLGSILALASIVAFSAQRFGLPGLLVEDIGVEPQESTRVCPRCGTQLPGLASYCLDCGQRLNSHPSGRGNGDSAG